MSSFRAPAPVHHDAHDRLAIAAAAAGDLRARDLSRASTLLAECAACRTLHDDLKAITAAVRQVPPIERPSPRAFQLSVADARQLARGARWRALLRPFGASRGPAIRPLAATLMTLGLVAFIASAQPLLQRGSGAAASSQGPQLIASAPVMATAPVMANAPASHARSAPAGLGAVDPFETAGGSPSASPADGLRGEAAVPRSNPGERAADDVATTVSPAPQILLPVLGGVLLVAGTFLLVLHRLALRLR
ncbi:MAG: hypothetical protein HYX54_10480 [Chloroflexi bacterium]|nr:hypothetical protein [Chloroflexota bacterium]